MNTTVRLVTFNIMFNDILFIERHEQLVNLLKKTNADVICLQEVLPQVAGYIAKELSEYKIAIKPQNRPYGELIFVKEGIKVMSKKIVKLPSKMNRVLNLAELKKGSLIFNVVTFHLESLANPQTRLEQEKILSKLIVDLPNVIACGDTNIKTGEKHLYPPNFKDAWVVAGQPPNGIYTFHGSRFWGTSTRERYDRVWLSTDWSSLDSFELLGSYINPKIGSWISDHDGIQIDVSGK